MVCAFGVLITLPVLLIHTAYCSVNGSQFIGLGYNLLQGNPDGDVLSRVGIDPGIQTTRHILEFTSDTKSRLIVSDYKTTCTQRNDTYIFYGAKSYQSYLMKGFVTFGAGDKSIKQYAFSVNSVFKDIEHRTSANHDVFRDIITVCNEGQTRYVMPPSFKGLHHVTVEFATAVCRLPIDYNTDSYRQFLDNWGTHGIVEVETGTRTVTRYRQSVTQLAEVLLSHDFGVGKVYIENYHGYGSVVHLNVTNLHHDDYYRVTGGHEEATLKVGTQNSPYPVRYKLATIAEFVKDAYWNGESVQSLSSCTKELFRRQFNIIRALGEYPGLKGRSSVPKDEEIKIPVTWPRGTYGLYKPNTGCPKSPIGWEEGFIIQDTENSNNGNNWTRNIHLEGQFNREKPSFYFCMKTAKDNSEYSRDWPKGNYCILKKGTCPSGFQSGSIKFDDEDDNNANSYNGVLPDGTYNSDTEIFYCCRADGPSTSDILLPIDKQFYLLRYTSSCQKVLGTTVREEFFAVDTEDTKNQDHFNSAYPYASYSGNGILFLYFCYYERLNPYQPIKIFG